MKKNAMLKIAAILMVAVLLTTCAISSTFAKYVTTAATATSNKAQVARWNVEITAKADSAALFTNNYGDVIADGEYNLVAPGTTKTANLLHFTLTGTPEVDFRLVATVALNLEGWTVDGKFYCPLVFKVGEESVDGTGYYDDADGFKTAVEGLVAKAIVGSSTLDEGKYYSAKYNAKTPVNTVTAADVEWSWAFETNELGNTRDTALGNSNAANTVQFAITLGAEQVNG